MSPVGPIAKWRRGVPASAQQSIPDQIWSVRALLSLTLRRPKNQSRSVFAPRSDVRRKLEVACTSDHAAVEHSAIVTIAAIGDASQRYPKVLDVFRPSVSRPLLPGHEASEALPAESSATRRVRAGPRCGRAPDQDYTSAPPTATPKLSSSEKCKKTQAPNLIVAQPHETVVKHRTKGVKKRL